ncbi:MAG: histidine phosphatase family protein [Haloarculaceae archaeon]
MARLLCVRHGETDWNRKGRIQGWAPTTLTATGRQQARDVGAHLASTDDVDRMVASDLQRCKETATRICESGVDVEPTFRRAWRERDFGIYQGLARETVLQRRPRARKTDSVTALEHLDNGENLDDFRTRVLDAFRRLRGDLAADETVLVVTHGGPLRVVLGEIKGLSVTETFQQESPANCAITELDVASGRLRRENETV